MQTRLSVTIDNRVIDCVHARDTFATVIEVMGVRRVACIKPNLVSTCLANLPKKIQVKPSRYRCVGDYYIAVDFSTEKRAEHVEDIAVKLGISINVQINPKGV